MVRLYAELARRMADGQRQLELELPAGSSIGDLLSHLQVPEEPAVIVGRNGRLAGPAESLTDGDRIELMTQMEGGAV